MCELYCTASASALTYIVGKCFDQLSLQLATSTCSIWDGLFVRTVSAPSSQSCDARHI
jgi:hypothetical protein